MTDGERLVWAASFARAIDVGDDGITAAKVAARTVMALRDASSRTGIHWTAEERDFLDEMASAP